MPPETPDSLRRLGTTHLEEGRPEEAVACWRQAFALAPDSAACAYDIGCVLHQLGRLAEAAPWYEQALALDPGHLEALNNLGDLRREEGRRAESAALLMRALGLKPDFAAALCNLGSLRRDEGRFAEAVALFERALAAAPDIPEGLNAKAMALRELGRLDEAVECCRAALASDPEFAAAQLNLGTALRDLGRYSEALPAYVRAVELAPGLAGAHLNLGLCRLLLGDFARGWPEYEWRLRLPDRVAAEPAIPRWTGREDLAGKTLLLEAEQGFGDTIQFCRYALVLAHRGGRIVLRVPKALAGLLSRLPGVSRTVTFEEPAPAADYRAALLSLPLALGTRLASIPSATLYLAPSPEHVATWRERLGPQRRPRLGLAWSGNPGHDNDRNRSIPLARLAPLLAEGFDVVSLQKEIRPSDQGALDADTRLRHFGDRILDFEDTAALASLMDVVVAVDTSAAHLAAALGRPTWLMLPFVPDWRWLLDREDSPWYPTMRLFRQAAIGDWEGVIARVAGALALWRR